jgi:hypothetical protein
MDAMIAFSYKPTLFSKFFCMEARVFNQTYDFYKTKNIFVPLKYKLLSISL